MKAKIEWQLCVAMGLWLVFSILFLGVYESDVIYNLHLGSFYCDADYYQQRVVNENGWMMLFARWLSQFFIYPMQSVICLSLVSGGLSLLLAKVVGIKANRVASAFLPAFFVAMSIGVVGVYMHNKILDVLVMPTLGLVYIILSLYAYSYLSRKEYTNCCRFLIAFIVIIGYVLGGIVGFSAGLAISVFSIRGLKKEALINFGITFVCSLFMFWWYSDTRYWLTPVSSFDYYIVALFQLLTLLSPSIVIIDNYIKNSDSVWGCKKLNDKIYSFCGANALIMLLMSGITFLVSERDEAFRGECKLTRLMVNNDFKGMLKAADEIENPNWPCYGFRLVALSQTETLEENMFKYTCRKSEFPISYEFHYPWLNLYAGQPLFSLSYAMDYHLFKEENYLNMLVMAYDYILIGEKDAAEKILDKMDDNIVYRNWCKRIRKYYNSHLEFAEHNKQFGKAMMGAFRENVIVGQIPFETTFKLPKKANGVNVSRRVYTALFEKDLDYFKVIMNAMGNMYRGVLPAPIQEAICVCSINGDNELLEKFPVSPIIGTKANAVLSDVKRGLSYDEVRKKHGDSYFTYYFFAVKPTRDAN